MEGGVGAVKVNGCGRIMIMCARIETEPNWMVVKCE